MWVTGDENGKEGGRRFRSLRIPHNFTQIVLPALIKVKLSIKLKGK